MLVLKFRNAQNGMSVTGQAFDALSATRSESDRKRWSKAEAEALKTQDYSIYGMAQDKGNFLMILKS